MCVLSAQLMYRRRNMYVRPRGKCKCIVNQEVCRPADVCMQAVCPIDSAAVKGITAQQSVQVNGIAAQACASWLTYMLRRRY